MRRGTGFPECAVRRETVPARIGRTRGAAPGPLPSADRNPGRVRIGAVRPGDAPGAPQGAAGAPGGPGTRQRRSAARKTALRARIGPFRGSGRAGNPRFRPQERRTGPPGRFRGSSLRGSRQRKRAAIWGPLRRSASGRAPGPGASPRLPAAAIRSSLPPGAGPVGNPAVTRGRARAVSRSPPRRPVRPGQGFPGLPRPCGGPSLAPRRRCDSLSFVSWRREGRAVAARCRPARPGPRSDPRSLFVSGDPGSRPADPPRLRCPPPWAGNIRPQIVAVAEFRRRHD